MDDADLRQLSEAIDRAVEELTEDDLPAYGGLGGLKDIVFGKLRRYTQRWRRAGSCVYPKCEERSINASHTIQEFSLRLVAENGLLLTPTFNFGEGSQVMREVGVGAASTFPGFCPSHEKVFSEFEQSGSIRTGRHAELQLFRTVCRELVAKRHEVEHFDTVIAAKESLLNAHLLERIVANLGARFLAKYPDLRMIASENISARLDAFKKIRQQRANALGLIEKELYHQSSEAINGNDVGLTWAKVKLTPRLPVALAGMSSFSVSRNGVAEEVDVVFHVIPATDGSDVMIACLESQGESFGLLLESIPPTPERWLDLIEGWMIYGTDQWFITPSFWISLPGPLRERILRESWDCPTHKSFKLDYEIFRASSLPDWRD